MMWFRKESSPEKKALDAMSHQLEAVKEKRRSAIAKLLNDLGEGSEKNLIDLTEELKRAKAGG